MFWQFQLLTLVKHQVARKYLSISDNMEVGRIGGGEKPNEKVNWCGKALAYLRLVREL